MWVERVSRPFRLLREICPDGGLGVDAHDRHDSRILFVGKTVRSVSDTMDSGEMIGYIRICTSPSVACCTHRGDHYGIRRPTVFQSTKSRGKGLHFVYAGMFVDFTSSQYLFTYACPPSFWRT
jgi:hypothetical protein